nr:Wzt carbohydrate-binding domain-containing protein [Candidatus Omnitrophota bacterium]
MFIRKTDTKSMIISLTNTKEKKSGMPIHNAVELCSVGRQCRFLKKSEQNSKDSAEYFWALNDVSFNVYKGQILGVIGRNGAGKTTLLNIVAGILTPTQGKIKINGRVFGLFNLGVGFQDELTGKENIFLNGSILGATKKELNSKLRCIIEFSELGEFINMPLGTYSQGMRLRLGFSIIVNLDCDTLVIDEILAVGDLLFQNKCFERLMEFKRLGKTLIISSQSMELIERLCDSVILLDHGQSLFLGDPVEATNRYRALLNTEKFFVGPVKKNINLVENTKKWTDDISNWGKELGTKEVVIKKVEFINKFGWKSFKIRSGESLRIKTHFTVRSKIKEPHFGVAIFRNDGVYCYGPNTKFEGYHISELEIGNGYFILDYYKLFLAPGEYKISIAIWDKNETIAFAYNHGYYRLIVEGDYNVGNQLIKIPFICFPRKFIIKDMPHPDLNILKDKWGSKVNSEGIEMQFVKLLNCNDEECSILTTDDPAKLAINFCKFTFNKDSYLWVGLYREDGVYCQGIMQPFNSGNSYMALFSKLSLLPGGYTFSVGVWDNSARKFIMSHHAVYPFRVVFDQEDHGTIYLKHKWSWRLP